MTTSSGQLEVEIKIKLTGVSQIRDTLPELGFTIQEPRQLERNILFDTPALDLASGHRLLRLRRYGERNIITFKRPAGGLEDEKKYKVREEIESGFDHFENMKTILLGLGYRTVWIYEKFREIWSRDGVSVFLDETPIGDFMEIEGTKGDIDRLASGFGYTKEDYIAVNYRRLWVDAGKTGNMIF